MSSRYLSSVLKCTVRAFVCRIERPKRHRGDVFEDSMGSADVYRFDVLALRKCFRKFERKFERQSKNCLRRRKVHCQGFRMVYQTSKMMVATTSSAAGHIYASGLSRRAGTGKMPLRVWWSQRAVFLSRLVASGVKPPEVLLSLVAAQASGGFTLVWVGTGRLSSGVGSSNGDRPGRQGWPESNLSQRATAPGPHTIRTSTLQNLRGRGSNPRLSRT